ncbi:LysE family transporter [Phaeovulum sp.]|uniref:LysE family transporter n=1 Tax=Phaeovulum sp. TaxID=2934796 RepID=UPI002730B644|nr:LysE family transporter [Phaeovulum sp.]MDP1670304.1 LysE family transporter [Phaeovulum sp.]MDZ4120633.1 LysE family transporter [Phaeovulum sp.]
MLFVTSMAMGLAIAAPLGPIGALCIQRTLAQGFFAGLAGGLGTALADALYASFAAAGFATFAATLARISTPLGLVGGGFLLWLAWKGWPRGVPAPQAAAAAQRPALATAALTFALTIANPATILSFAAIFAGLGLAETASLASAVQVVAGVFAGSMLWWFILAGAVAALHHRLPTAFALWVARVSSLMMGGFGLWALANAVA